MKEAVENLFNLGGWCGSERNIHRERNSMELRDDNYKVYGGHSRRYTHSSTPSKNTGGSNATRGTPDTQMSDERSLRSTAAADVANGPQNGNTGIMTTLVQSLFCQCEPMLQYAKVASSNTNDTQAEKVVNKQLPTPIHVNDDLELAIKKGLQSAQRSNTMDEDDQKDEAYPENEKLKIPVDKKTSRLVKIQDQVKAKHRHPHRREHREQQQDLVPTEIVQIQPVAGDADGFERYSLPFRELFIDILDARQLERSISELTMRSHGDAYLDFLPTNHSGPNVPANRRMAYYAVGKRAAEALQSKGEGDKYGGSHRRCFFTGRVIHSGEPFYAGSVQQGMRSLIVFCLPRSIGLPKSLIHGHSDEAETLHEPERMAYWHEPQLHRSRSDSTGKYSNQTYGSFSEGETVFRSEKEQEQLLRSLPDPSDGLLYEMQKRYPEPYSSLPLPVQNAANWRLYNKFCFFSGLPVAEGEMHFRVKSGVVNKTFNDEVILSYEVMEAVNGEQSAEILKLPNKKTFTYLRKNYAQQSAKLDPAVFQRTSWEMKLPEC